MVGTDKVKVYWDKSVENRQVSDTAYQNQQFNASASRYYYALYHGFWALFEKNGISVPREIWRRGGWIQNPYNSWPKPELKRKADEIWSLANVDLEDIISRSERLRIKGDYDPIPVEYRELKSLKLRADIVFEEIDKKINTDE